MLINAYKIYGIIVLGVRQKSSPRVKTDHNDGC